MNRYRHQLIANLQYTFNPFLVLAEITVNSKKVFNKEEFIKTYSTKIKKAMGILQRKELMVNNMCVISGGKLCYDVFDKCFYLQVNFINKN